MHRGISSLRIGCALLCAALVPPYSAAAADEFTVSKAQLQALGVTLQSLEQPGEIRGLAYPARVILPPQQERVASAPVAGVVDQLLVEEHQRIELGQPLLRLNSPEFGQLQLAALEAANRNQLAQQALERERALLAEGIVAQRRVFEAEAAATDSRAELRQARATLRLAGLAPAAIERLIRSGTPQESLLLRAQSAGVIVGMDVRPGQRVAAADPLVHIADPSRLWLDVQIPADRARAWPKDGEILVVGREVTAKPLDVSAMVGEGQTVSLRSEVTRGAELLRPGEFVQVQVPFGHTAGAWTLPLAAVVREDGKAYVFVRTPKGFAARSVSIVASAAQSISVEGSLEPSDQIAVTRVTALKAAWLSDSATQDASQTETSSEGGGN
jgi:RND family efflux transporter MFP subunit